MLKLINYLPPLPEPFIGCEIETLFECYHNEWKRFNLYISEHGGVLCCFGSRAIVSGKVSFEELLPLAMSLGILSIEGLRQDLPCSDLPCSNSPFSPLHYNKHYKSYSILEYDGTLEGDIPSVIDQNPVYKTVFTILASSDEDFYKNADYLDCLSHATQLKLYDKGFIYAIDIFQTASVIAINDSHGFIAQVATIPLARGRGFSSLVIKALCMELKQRNLTPFVTTEGVLLNGFYQKLGFSYRGEKIIISIELLNEEQINEF